MNAEIIKIKNGWKMISLKNEKRDKMAERVEYLKKEKVYTN